MGADGYGDIKRKIRKLKQSEKIIRRLDSDAGLVWTDFFTVKYPPKVLAAMDRQAYKDVVAEFYYGVYYKYCAENSASMQDMYDPEVLSRLGLPPDADARMIKSRFRELAKRFHPDAGGDDADFIALKKDYDSLYIR